MDSLIAEIAENPEDDHARLVWADAVGGERGELVALQCALARNSASSAQRRRVRELLRANGLAWSGLAEIAEHVQFWRGFVDAIAISPAKFLAHAEQIFAVAPLLQAITFEGFAQHKDLTWNVTTGSDPIALLRRVFEHPAYRKLRGAAFNDLGITLETESEFHPRTWDDHTEQGIALAQELGAFEHLTALGMIGNAAIPLQLWDQVDRAHVSAPLERMPALRALDCERLDAEQVARLPPSLVELRVGALRDRALALLLAHPLARSLERLTIHHSSLHGSLAVLGALPKLRSLHVSESFDRDDSDAVATFCNTSMPALRELHVDFEARHLARIALAFGSQLELLEARPLHLVGYLTALGEVAIAGDLHIERWDYDTRLLHTHHDRGPLWDPPPLPWKQS